MSNPVDECAKRRFGAAAFSLVSIVHELTGALLLHLLTECLSICAPGEEIGIGEKFLFIEITQEDR